MNAPARIDSFTGPYWFLSNFSLSRVEWGGWPYLTVEHAYQAAKTDDLAWRWKILGVTAPAEAKRLGRLSPLRPDWEEVKIEVMRGLLRQKFAIPSLRLLLLETGDAELIEGNYWRDEFWGVYKGRGLNWLGRLLMEVRAEIREGQA